MLLNRSLGSGGVGYSLLLKGTGSCISAFMYVSKVPFQEKKKKQKTRTIKGVSAFLAKRMFDWTALKRPRMASLACWLGLICSCTDIHLKKVFERCLEVMVSSEVRWGFHCPSRCSARSKMCRGSRTSGGEWWRGDGDMPKANQIS